MRNLFFLTLSVATAAILVGCSTSAAPPELEASVRPPASASTLAPSGSPASPSPSAEPSTAPNPKDEPAAENSDGYCHTDNLKVSLSNEGSSAGKIHYAVTFTNTGEECLIEGFPGIQVMAGGTPLGVPAANDSGQTPSSMRLTRGGTTSAELTVTNITSGGGPLGDACTVGQGDAFAVTPPHATRAIRVPMSNVPACSNGTPWMTVGPVVNWGTT